MRRLFEDLIVVGVGYEYLTLEIPDGSGLTFEIKIPYDDNDTLTREVRIGDTMTIGIEYGQKEDAPNKK